MSEQLAGWWFCSGERGEDERGTLELERRADGSWYNLEFGNDVRAYFSAELLQLAIEEINLPELEFEGNQVPMGNFLFLPDPGECERIGLPIEYSRLPDDVTLQ